MPSANDLYQTVESVVEIVDYWSCLLLVVVLFIVGVYFTIRLNFFQIRQLKEAVLLSMVKNEPDVVKERIEEIEQSEGDVKKAKKAELTPLQAFCLSMGSRIGVGSLAGVAIALMTGGPGSIFWMWVFGFLGAAISFVETVLGQIYKERHPDGSFHGGMVYYIRNGMKNPKFALFMVILGILTAGFACSGVQANTAATCIATNFNLPPVVPALIMTALIGLVIFGGVKRAAFISTIIVPIMALGFIAIGLVIICMNITAVPGALLDIVQDAFYFDAGLAGFLGFIVAVGVQRGIFMTNAGLGVTPSITSSVKSKHPVEQGLVQARGVFLDMQVICTITALVILLTGDYIRFGSSGIILLQKSLEVSFVGPVAAPIVTLLLTVVFAFTCCIGKYSFGEESARYLSNNKKMIFGFRIVYLAVIFVSCVAGVSIVWMITDTFIAIMTMANIIALIVLGKKAVEAIKDYVRQKKEGIKTPVFTSSALSDASGVTAWPTELNKEQVKTVSPESKQDA